MSEESYEVFQGKQAVKSIYQFAEQFGKEIDNTEDFCNEEVKAHIRKLAALAEENDYEILLHLSRVGSIAKIITSQLAKMPNYSFITPQYINTIEIAAALHDIGKVGIDERILLKKGRLTPEEFSEIKKHVDIGMQIFDFMKSYLKNSDFINMCMEIITFHHERFDGKGYPQNADSKSIPLSGQIIIVADIYDALRSKRPYKEPMPHQDSLEIIKKGKNTLFNPEILEAFFACEKEIEEYSAQAYDYNYTEYDD